MLILVTGGAGFIASYMVEKLVNEGFEVRVLDNLSYGSINNLDRVLGRIEFFKGDVRNLNIVRKTVKDADIIIHLAALISVEKSFEKPWETEEVNVLGTINLLKTSVENDVNRFIYVSSAAVYGKPIYLPIDEDHPTNPISPYGVSKLTAEHYINVFNGEYDLNTIILRLFNVYGPRQEYNQYSGVIRIFLENVVKKEPLPIYGDGEQTRASSM